MIKTQRILVGILLAQRRRRWPSITSALGQCIVFSEKWPFWWQGTVRANAGQSPNSVSMLGQRRKLWVNIETALVNVMCLLICWRKVYRRPSVGLVLGQRRRRLNQQWAATLAQHWANNGRIVLHHVYEVHRRGAYIDLSVNVTVRSLAIRTIKLMHRRWWWKEYTLKIF